MTAHGVFLGMSLVPILGLILVAATVGTDSDPKSETAMGWAVAVLLASIVVGIVGLVLT